MPQLFEAAREEAEEARVLQNPRRDTIRSLMLRGLFMQPRLLRFAGRLLWLYQATRRAKLLRILRTEQNPSLSLTGTGKDDATGQGKFSGQLIKPIERPKGPIAYRVAVLTGCVQDIVFSDINRDTVDVLLANGCEVYTPGSSTVAARCMHIMGKSRRPEKLARLQIDAFELNRLNAIITNAAGCGSHLKSYGTSSCGRPASIRLGHANGRRKFATFMSGFVRLGFESRASANARIGQTVGHLPRGVSSVSWAKDHMAATGDPECDPGLELIELR